MGNEKIASQIMQKCKTNDPVPPYRAVPPDFANKIRKQEIIEALDAKDQRIKERANEIENLNSEVGHYKSLNESKKVRVNSLLEKVKEAECEAITSKWQDKIRDVFIEAGVPSDQIDGKGSDAGALEFTECEVQQGVNSLLDHVEELQEKLKVAVSALEDLISKAHEMADVVNCSGDYQELLDYIESETKARDALKAVK